MVIKKKTLPKSWQKSEKNIRAVQVVFELDQKSSKNIRLAAIENDQSFSDQIRDILELPKKRPVRPRLSVSLSEQDYQVLAKRYGLKTTDKEAIRESMKKELMQFKRQSRS